MIALRIASLVAALVTITLNASHGFASSKVLEYAILLSALNAALDTAKCALIGAASRAWRVRAYGLAALCLLLFPLLFANSVWNAVTQIAITRDEVKAQLTSALQSRTRAEAEYKRLSDELALMKANPTFAATTACTLPKSPAARAFCSKVEDTKAALTTASTQLASTSPKNPDPLATLLSAMTGLALPTIQFNAALWPVLIAELLGSLGFYIASRIAEKPLQRPAERFSWWKAVSWRVASETHSPPVPGSSGAPAPPPPPAAPSPSSPAPSPSLTWTLPKAT